MTLLDCGQVACCMNADSGDYILVIDYVRRSIVKRLTHASKPNCHITDMCALHTGHLVVAIENSLYVWD